jgi:hypothetical protein
VGAGARMMNLKKNMRKSPARNNKLGHEEWGTEDKIKYVEMVI